MTCRHGFVRCVAVLAMVFAAACDEGTPTAPTGTILHVSANPTLIATTGSSAITIQAVRSNGNPVNPGTEIRLSTTIGTIESVVYTDDDGVAHATLHGNGQSGTATVSAYSGAVEAVTAEVVVGVPAGSIQLTVSPTSVPETGGTLTLLALVRDEQGQPLAGASVNFSSEAGTLDSGGEFVLTDAGGAARDELVVTALELQVIGGDSFEVSARVGSEASQVDTFDVGIQRPPHASFTASVNGNTVSFTDTSTGSPTSWIWDFGDSNSSTQQNPVHTYAGPGTYVVILTARNAVGESTFSAPVTISI